jgi:histidinol dehydrogenase
VRLTPGEATDRLARAAAPIARAEGFELHARSMEARIRDNRPR